MRLNPAEINTAWKSGAMERYLVRSSLLGLVFKLLHLLSEDIINFD